METAEGQNLLLGSLSLTERAFADPGAEKGLLTQDCRRPRTYIDIVGATASRSDGLDTSNQEHNAVSTW